MRFLGMFLASTLALIAQVDPEYVIPKENPLTSPADLKVGENVFLGQCAGCHGPKGEGGRGAVLAQPRLRHAADDESLFRVKKPLRVLVTVKVPSGWADSLIQ